MTLQTILMIVLAAAALLSLAVLIVFYIFKGIGLFTIGRRRHLKAGALAWIPILSMFKLGQIADDAVLKKRGKRTHYVFLYPIFNIAGGVLSCVSAFLTLVAVRFTPELINAFLRGDFDILRRHAQEAITDPVFYVGLAIAALGSILVTVASVFLYISLYHIYKSCSGKYVVMFVLTLVFSFLYPIFLLAVRKNDNLVWYPAGTVQNETGSYGTESTF